MEKVCNRVPRELNTNGDDVQHWGHGLQGQCAAYASKLVRVRFNLSRLAQKPSLSQVVQNHDPSRTQLSSFTIAQNVRDGRDARRANDRLQYKRRCFYADTLRPLDSRRRNNGRRQLSFVQSGTYPNPFFGFYAVLKVSLLDRCKQAALDGLHGSN